MEPIDSPSEQTNMVLTKGEKIILDAYRNDPRKRKFLQAFIMTNCEHDTEVIKNTNK